MKIILRADVENLGRLGEIVTVKPGYGRNFLLPKGLAMLASPGNIKQFEAERKKLQKQMDDLKSAAQGLAGQLAGVEVVITMRVGENEKLYGSVTAGMIAAKLAEQGIELDKRKIGLDEPIRSLGIHEIDVKLHADVLVPLRVKVARLGGDIEVEIPAAPEAAEEASAPEASEA